MSSWRRYALPAGLMVAGLILLASSMLSKGGIATKSPAAQFVSSDEESQSTPTIEPILPTRTVEGVSQSAIPGSTVSTATPSFLTLATVTQDASSHATANPGPPVDVSSGVSVPETTPIVGEISYRSRFGLSGSLSAVEPARAAGLLFSLYYNWQIVPDPVDLPGIGVWQTVRVSEDGVQADWQDIAAAAAANPGSVWMIGNEPDVIWQDNVTPERYATLYHETYAFIKARDPTAFIANGGVSMPTPLRQAYLDRVLEAYAEQYGHSMPVDIWNIHAYILREEAGSWGVEIPPGMDALQHLGRRYEIEDHDDVDIFKQNLVEFRAWMAARGLADRPLAVTEFGVLMPPDYGFPPEANGRFMREAVTFMATATNENGYPSDDGKLVQWWFWYSLYDTVGQYGVADLYDPERDRLTHLGLIWNDLVQQG